MRNDSKNLSTIVISVTTSTEDDDEDDFSGRAYMSRNFVLERHVDHDFNVLAHMVTVHMQKEW